MRQHTPLILVGGDQPSKTLTPVPLQTGMGAGGYDEAWVRDLFFEHPEAIPVGEIDGTFGPLIPVCTELDTRAAGFADTLYVNRFGLPTLAPSGGGASPGALWLERS